MYDLRKRSPIAFLHGPHTVGDSIEFVDEDTLLTGSFTTSHGLQTWDLRKMEVIQDIEWNAGLDEDNFSSHDFPRINFAKVTRNAKKMNMLIAGGDTDEIRVFDKDYKPIISINGMSRSTFTCDTNKRGDVVAIGGGDGVIRVFRLGIISSSFLPPASPRAPSHVLPQ